MCNLCSPDREQRAQARTYERDTAEQLEKLARLLRMIASGEHEPHTDQAVYTATVARDVLRRLFMSEWL